MDFQPTAPSAPSTTQRRLGFRYFALVTGDDTDAAYVASARQEQGTASVGMYFRINGAAFWSKGARWVLDHSTEDGFRVGLEKRGHFEGRSG